MSVITTCPIPAGATDVSDWSPDGLRSFDGTSRCIVTVRGYAVTVDIGGEQYRRDGGIDRWIALGGECESPLEATEARQVAADLLAAADEVDVADD